MGDLAAVLYSHVEALYPICRSITGDGLRATLRYIGARIPLEMREIPSGSKVLDWEVPDEWNVRDAAVMTLSDRRVIDFRRHNLHLLQYSEPVDRIIDREELDQHLYSLPEQPALIPYRTSYYKRTWGFCLSQRDRLALDEPRYRVLIDTTLGPGNISYGECVVPGQRAEEVLFSIHCCHPSLANDNLSGIAAGIELARFVASSPRRFTYRFLFIPGTIGAITWLHFNRDMVHRVRHGLVLSCVGDPAPPSYKQSRQGNALIDRYMAALLREEGHPERVTPFSPYGYDERQYCSPGFNLPVGCFMRSRNGTFPEYHTSADNLQFVRPEALANSLDVLQRLIAMVEQDELWRSTSPWGEPQLGRRGLYDSIAANERGFDQMAMLWVLNLADGNHRLIDVAERSGKPFGMLAAAAAALADAGLLVRNSRA
ncbi:MAG: DUF4910 domain-containing protein [Acetobacteraceae bacterium]|nr:DUF4910 domain-containing protein [Acetobacteraceae bacterium]